MWSPTSASTGVKEAVETHGQVRGEGMVSAATAGFAWQPPQGLIFWIPIKKFQTPVEDIVKMLLSFKCPMYMLLLDRNRD